MNNERYGFFLDIDNTLYTKGIIPQQNLDAIDYVRSKGHMVFINTARSLANVPEIVKNLPVDGFITSIGCRVIINGEKLLSVAFSPENLADELDFITENKMKFVIEGENTIIGNRFCEGQSGFSVVKDGKELLEKFSDEIMPKVFIEGILPENCMNYLSRSHKVFQHSHYAEYAVDGYSKAGGMLFAAEKCGIPQKNCVAMGDSENDRTMLEAAGISVAMGNAVDSIKEICDFVSCDSQNGGVAQAMYKIINKKED